MDAQQGDSPVIVVPACTSLVWVLLGAFGWAVFLALTSLAVGTRSDGGGFAGPLAGSWYVTVPYSQASWRSWSSAFARP